MRGKENTALPPSNTGTGMTDKELKRLRRVDLLELLITLGRENEQLRQRIEDLEQQLADRTLIQKEAGSIAEAALALNGVFETAQKAADQYLENVRRLAEEARETHSVTEEEEVSS